LFGIFSYVNFSDRLFVHPRNGEGIVLSARFGVKLRNCHDSVAGLDRLNLFVFSGIELFISFIF